MFAERSVGLQLLSVSLSVCLSDSLSAVTVQRPVESGLALDPLSSSSVSSVTSCVSHSLQNRPPAPPPPPVDRNALRDAL